MPVLITDFLDDLMPRLPGAEEGFVQRETLAALREFCADSGAWRHKFKDESTVADSPVLSLTDQPAGSAIGVVYRVAYTKDAAFPRNLEPASASIFLRGKTGNRPLAFYMETPAVVHIAPVLSEDFIGLYDADVSLIPIDLAVEMPDEFLAYWRDAVIDGTMLRMVQQVSKPWTSITLARYHGRRFRSHIKRARDTVKSEYSPADAPWRYPLFARKNIRGI